MASSSFSSPSHNWVYDVFPSFSGEDVRVTFLAHFLKELDRKLIIAFKDKEIERGESLDPELKKAIQTSRIAVVMFSEKYASSSWCLNELLEIVRCKEMSGQIVIPVFYSLDPSHVRKQTGKFGEAFFKTCQNQTEDATKLWQKALTDVANVLGYHSQKWDNEAKMIEDITNEILKKLLLSTSKDSEDFVGIENHLVEMSSLLHLESEEVRMVGIWGASGIGKTTIARALYNRISSRFKGSLFIDKAYIYESKKIYDSANPDDYNMKLHLQRSLLSNILDKKDIKIDRLGAVEERLKHQKVLIVIDDLNDQVVLDALVGETHWFGGGSRIIVITKDKHFLRAHRIDHIYEVGLPTEMLALEMFCQSAFRQKSPPNGLMDLASEVSLLAGKLPLGITVLGSYLRGRDKEDLMDMLPSLRRRLNGKIEKTLRVSYDGLDCKKDKMLFRHIACLFNGESVNHINLLLADTDLKVNVGLKSLVDMSLIHISEWNTVVMHDLLQDMGKKIVRAQSNDPGKREFLVDSKDICELLEDNNSQGTKEVLGITLDMDEIDELHIQRNSFEGMRNLRFLKMYNTNKEVRWHVPESFDYLPHKLRLLRWDGYPMRRMPSNFRPENLVKLQMQDSKLEKLWEGVQLLAGLREMDLEGSKNLEEIPDLSMATNLEKLHLSDCWSLVELTSSIQYLNKLEKLEMRGCRNLEILPIGINLKSLDYLDLGGCSRLMIFPNISTNISILNLHETLIGESCSVLHLKRLTFLNMSKMKTEALWEREKLTSLMTLLSPTLERLILSDIPTLVELPSSIQNFKKLETLIINDCINLEILPTGINLQHLSYINFEGCTRLKTFPDISTNISSLDLCRTGIEEVPSWIEKFSRLDNLAMNGCINLQYVSTLKLIHRVDLSDCRALTEASWNDSSSAVVVAKDNTHTKLPVTEVASSSFPDNFINCFYLDQQVSFHGESFLKYMLLSGEEVPSYFTHRATETSSSLTIPLLPSSHSQTFLKFKACVVVDFESSMAGHFAFDIHISCRFKGRPGIHFDSPYLRHPFYKDGEAAINLVLFGCSIPLYEDNASLAELMSYDRMDIQFHLSHQYYSPCKLKGWGIRLYEDCELPKKELCNSKTLPHACEEYGQSNDGYIDSETDQSQDSEDHDYSDTSYETDDSGESRDSHTETKRSSKRRRIT